MGNDVIVATRIGEEEGVLMIAGFVGGRHDRPASPPNVRTLPVLGRRDAERLPAASAAPSRGFARVGAVDQEDRAVRPVRNFFSLSLALLEECNSDASNIVAPHRMVAVGLLFSQFQAEASPSASYGRMTISCQGPFTDLE